MRQFYPALVFVALAALLTGCASTPVIDKARFARPTSIAIVQPPPMRNFAHVGIFVIPDSFAYPRHFSRHFDPYFVTTGPVPQPARPVIKGLGGPELAQAAVLGNPATQSVGAAAVGGMVGGMLQAVEESSAKKALQYDQEVRTRMPDFDLRKDIVSFLKEVLQQRGVAVTVIEADATTGPRLLWPAKGYVGFAEVGSPDAPAVDADLVLQISPAAYWFAPGLMNNFRRTGSIGVMIYNGRTKEYLGSQVFGYDPPAFDGEYSLYDSLVTDSAGATGAMREGMLSLVPQIAEALIPGPVKPWHR
jgi:hypothetical protein